MIAFLTQGFTVGLSAGVMPGPMQSYLMNTALKYGRGRALMIVITPLIIDIPIIFAVLFALDTLAAFVPVVINIIRVVGGVFVLYLAWGAWTDFRQGVSLTDGMKDVTLPDEPAHRTLTQALIMNLLSPGPYLFWTTVNGPALLAALENSVWWGLAFVGAFYGTFLGVMVLIVLGIDRLRQVDPRLTNGLLLVIAVLLGGFGFYLILQGITVL